MLKLRTIHFYLTCNLEVTYYMKRIFKMYHVVSVSNINSEYILVQYNFERTGNIFQEYFI